MNQRPSPESFYRYFPVSSRDRSWGLFVTTLGQARYPSGAGYPLRGHPEGYAFDWKHGRRLTEYGLVYISRGQGSFEAEGCEPCPISAGDVLLLYPGVWHRYRPDAATGWEEHWVVFNGEIAERLVSRHFFSKKNPVLRATREIWLRGIFSEAIDAIQSSQPALQQVLAGMTMHMLALLFSARQKQEVGDDQAHDMVQSAIQQMRANLNGSGDMQVLARRLNVSYSTFRHTFAAHTGMSPLQYLLKLRLSLARSLLLETTLPVKTIAEKAGFADEHYFYRYFRREMGITPTAWRSRSRPRKT